MKLFLAACLILAAPAVAQDLDAASAKLEACLGDLDIDAVADRAETFMADGQARVDALCAAGDAAGADAVAREVGEAFYAADPDAARMRACIAEAFGPDEVAIENVCD